MIKIVVMSDNHGDDNQIKDIQAWEKDAMCFVHCGDSETWHPQLLAGFYAVRGNNDWALDLPNQVIFEMGEHRILVTHGHRYGYFDRVKMFSYLAKENSCDIVFCGHTHMPMNCIQDGVHVINPGSTRLPRGGYENTYCVCYLDRSSVEVIFHSAIDGKILEI